jgi:regulator of replication initiation timing
MNQKHYSTTESDNLRKMLSEIYSQISIPYIKKRASQNSHKHSPVDELQDAISYLTEKERELQVALDIAKYLLDSNEELNSRIEKLRETQTALCEENQFLINENKFLEQRIQGRSLRCDEISESLAKTEGKLKVFANNMKKYQENSARTLNQLADQEDLMQAKIFYENQSEILSSKF